METVTNVKSYVVLLLIVGFLVACTHTPSNVMSDDEFGAINETDQEALSEAEQNTLSFPGEETMEFEDFGEGSPLVSEALDEDLLSEEDLTPAQAEDLAEGGYDAVEMEQDVVDLHGDQMVAVASARDAGLEPPEVARVPNQSKTNKGPKKPNIQKVVALLQEEDQEDVALIPNISITGGGNVSRSNQDIEPPAPQREEDEDILPPVSHYKLEPVIPITEKIERHRIFTKKHKKNLANPGGVGQFFGQHWFLLLMLFAAAIVGIFFFRSFLRRHEEENRLV